MPPQCPSCNAPTNSDGKYSPDIVAAAKQSNETDHAPYKKFAGPGFATSMGWVAGDPDGRDSWRVQSSIDRRALKDKLPGGTDRLVDSVKENVDRGVGVDSGASKVAGAFRKKGK